VSPNFHLPLSALLLSSFSPSHTHTGTNTPSAIHLTCTLSPKHKHAPLNIPTYPYLPPYTILLLCLARSCPLSPPVSPRRQYSTPALVVWTSRLWPSGLLLSSRSSSFHHSTTPFSWPNFSSLRRRSSPLTYTRQLCRFAAPRCNLRCCVWRHFSHRTVAGCFSPPRQAVLSREAQRQLLAPCSVQCPQTLACCARGRMLLGSIDNE
jgi:hypothetical protein